MNFLVAVHSVVIQQVAPLSTTGDHYRRHCKQDAQAFPDALVVYLEVMMFVSFCTYQTALWLIWDVISCGNFRPKTSDS